MDVHLEHHLESAKIPFRCAEGSVVARVKGTFREFDVRLLLLHQRVVRLQALVPTSGVHDRAHLKKLCAYMRDGFCKSLEFGFFPASEHFCVSKYTKVEDVGEHARDLAEICDSAVPILERVAHGDPYDYRFCYLALLSPAEMFNA